MASYRGDRVNPGDALDCSLYGDLRIAEEEPEEDLSSNHNLFLSPCFLLVVPLISLYLRRNPGRRIDRINSAVSTYSSGTRFGFSSTFYTDACCTGFGFSRTLLVLFRYQIYLAFLGLYWM